MGTTSIRVMERCGACYGRGWVFGGPRETGGRKQCPRCHGGGWDTTAPTTQVSQGAPDAAPLQPCGPRVVGISDRGQGHGPSSVQAGLWDARAKHNAKRGETKAGDDVVEILRDACSACGGSGDALAALDNESDLLPPATVEQLAAQFDALCKADTGLVEDREEDHAD
jgi:hypothetical protein